MVTDTRGQRTVRERVLAEYFPKWSASKPSELVDPDWSFLTPGIAKWFLAAIDRGVVEITSAGGAALRDARQSWLFERDGTAARLYREGFLEIAAAGILALQFGWPSERLSFQSPKPEGLGGRPWSFDLLAYGDDDRTDVVIAGEVKWRQRDALDLARTLESCGARGDHHEEQCRKPNAHRKYAALLSFRPRLLWIIGSEALDAEPDLVFRVDTASGGVVQLAPAGAGELAFSRT